MTHLHFLSSSNVKNIFLLLICVIVSFMKIGMVLEGGGMRGMYTAGVLDVLSENNISVDVIIGVSAGAVFGCNFKSKQIGRTIRYNTKYCRNPEYSSIRSLIFTGDYFGADFCYNKIPFALDVFNTEVFKKNPCEFYVTCTDVETGKPVYHKCEKGDKADLQWFRASASMPLVSRIVDIEGQKLLDGGVSDSIPLSQAISMGCQKNIVILTQPKNYVKKPNKMLPLIKIKYKKYPLFVETMANRHVLYNEQISLVENAENQGNAFVFRPKEPLPVSRTEKDPLNLRQAYEIGRRDCLSKFTGLKDFLKN